MTGTDWDRVRRELRSDGYPGLTFDGGETAVPGLSGEWVIGEIKREGKYAPRRSRRGSVC